MTRSDESMNNQPDSEWKNHRGPVRERTLEAMKNPSLRAGFFIATFPSDWP